VRRNVCGTGQVRPHASPDQLITLTRPLTGSYDVIPSADLLAVMGGEEGLEADAHSSPRAITRRPGVVERPPCPECASSRV
jgi:hypothetical protein